MAMLVHQPTNSVGNYNFNAFFYKNYRMYYHFHGNYEVVYMVSGKADVMVDNRTEELTEGSTGVTIISTELLSEELSETEGSFEHPVLKRAAITSTATVIFLKIILSPFLRRHT
jgi:uncharacterized RmlC-like cupin family protein